MDLQRSTANLQLTTTRDTVLATPDSEGGGSPYVNNRPLLVASKAELREYKCMYAQRDGEIGRFSDEIVVYWAPWEPTTTRRRV